MNKTVLEQLSLDLPFYSSQSIDDFFVGGCNADAIRYLEAWPKWQHNVLIIIGPPKSGKSHLASIFAKRTNAIVLDANSLPDKQHVGPFIIENGDEITNEQNVFHIINWTKEIGSQLLITARKPVAMWDISLPDLSSRLLACPSIEIGFPDEALLEAMFIKLFADRQVRVPPNVIQYLVPRVERTYSSVVECVAALDAAAMTENRKISIPLIKDVLEDSKFLDLFQN